MSLPRFSPPKWSNAGPCTQGFGPFDLFCTGRLTTPDRGRHPIALNGNSCTPCRVFGRTARRSHSRRATRSALHAVVVESDASRSVSRILSPPAVGDGHPSWMPVARHLVRSDPGPGTSSPWTPRRPPLFDLAPGGVYLAGRSPDRRWALTPPFHRCRDRVGRGCVLSVALSFGSPRLDVIQRPALWSPDFPQAANRPRPSDRLALSV